MNREISNHYRTLVGKRLSEKLALEALYAAIRNEDISIIKAYRGKAPTNEDEWEEKKCEDMYPMRFALREMAHVSVLEALLDIGFTLPSGPDVTPFSGTPEEITAFLMRAKGIGRKEAVSYLLFSSSYYLDVLRKDSYFQIPFRLNPDDIYEPGFLSYLNSWIIDFALFLKKEDIERGKEEAFNLGQICRVFVEDEEFFEALQVCMSLGIFDEYDEGWMLSRAICHDNEKAFDLLLSRVSDDSLCDINSYPRKNMRILEKMFSHEILIPGTDQAFEAFEHFIYRFNSEYDNTEILKRLMHSSYAKRRNDSGNPALLDAAVCNDNFTIDCYPILAPTKEDINARDSKGRTVLYYIAKRYPCCIEDLMNAGADPYDVDENGNTVLHIMIAEGKYDVTIDDFKDVAKILPEDILQKRNNEGKTPIDLFAELLTKTNGAE